MPYDPNNPSIPYVDENLRSVPLGQPGLNDLDNPIYQYVSRGEDSKSNQTKINDQIINDLMKNNQTNANTVLNKCYYYPESIGNINPRSFVDGHETPRHIVKFTALDYAGGNLLSKEGKKYIDNFNISDPSTWVPDKFGDLFVDGKNLLQSEVYNYQERANTLSSGNSNLNKILNNAAKEGASQQEQNKLREDVSKYLNGPFGKDFTSRYLTSKDNPLIYQSLLNEISSKTQINSNLLPDEIKAIVYLYASGDNLSFNYATNWDAKEQNSIFPNLQNAAANLAENGDAGQAITDVGKSLIARILKQGIVPSSDAGRALISKFGVAPAQNYEYMFENVGRRNFNFNTTFYPKNKKEIENTAKIINAFKYYSHPSRPDRSSLVRVPCVFLIENLTYVDGKGWTENLFLPKYKLCALLNTSVDYSQNGTLITHEDMFSSEGTFKSPVKINMGLNFQEIHVLTREDIADPNKFFDGKKEQNGYY